MNWKGRKLLIATKHLKELVIAPILEKELGVDCFVAEGFDSDELGTFTGEIERIYDPITTARKKCQMAMQQFNCDLAVASEGSFGPHPSVFFVPADDEFLLFIDKKNDLEIVVRELSTDTNFNSAEIKSVNELKDFAASARFPSHGLILRKSKNEFSEISKGITDWKTLFEAYHKLSQSQGSVYIETDMRAMFNPTRMKVIEQATVQLANKINSLCPQCKAPGFGVTKNQPGLPCELCDLPTKSTLSLISECQKCSFAQESSFPEGKTKENPIYCDHCNP